MIWLVVAVMCGIIVEVFSHVPLRKTVDGILTLARKSAGVISSRSISDHWKEKAVGAYSLAMIRRTGMLFGMLVLLLAIVWVCTIIGRTFSLDVSSFLLTWYGILYSIVIAVLYQRLRFRNA